MTIQMITLLLQWLCVYRSLECPRWNLFHTRNTRVHVISN